MSILGNLRLCIVKDQSAFFHKWSDKSEIIPPSARLGGHNGGIVQATVGIVEYKDGTVHECYPHEVRFVDEINNLLHGFKKKEDE